MKKFFYSIPVFLILNLIATSLCYYYWSFQKSILLKEIEHIKLKVYDLQQDTSKAKIKIRLLALKKDSLISIGKNLSTIKNLDFQKEEIKTELGNKFDSLEELIFQESLKSIELKSTEEKITIAIISLSIFMIFYTEKALYWRKSNRKNKNEV